ncbi:MAG: hypothetical protein LBH39_07335 [Clostridiales Family XIII bacterium]|jgi:hypothetical protein|nr:hypothetical protein [Clostridiales Family XIII bacterium]
MKNGNSRPALFLTEMIVAILIFALCMGVCGGMFVRAFTASSKSTNLNNAVFIAESLAESFRSHDDLQEMAEKLGGFLGDDMQTLTLYYDKGWGYSEHLRDAGFAVTITAASGGDAIRTADISVYGGTGLILELKSSKNILLEAGKR